MQCWWVQNDAWLDVNLQRWFIVLKSWCSYQPGWWVNVKDGEGEGPSGQVSSRQDKSWIGHTTHVTITQPKLNLSRVSTLSPAFVLTFCTRVSEHLNTSYSSILSLFTSRGTWVHSVPSPTHKAMHGTDHSKNQLL